MKGVDGFVNAQAPFSDPSEEKDIQVQGRINRAATVAVTNVLYGGNRWAPTKLYAKRDAQVLT